LSWPGLLGRNSSDPDRSDYLETAPAVHTCRKYVVTQLQLSNQAVRFGYWISNEKFHGLGLTTASIFGKGSLGDLENFVEAVVLLFSQIRSHLSTTVLAQPLLLASSRLAAAKPISAY